MKPKLILLLIAFVSISFAGCGVIITRVEKDNYTISQRDTTNVTEQKNAPGNRDNGVVYPSSRTIKSTRELVQYDSLVERDYPDFIRLGLFESVGIIGGNSKNAMGSGLLGLFPDFSTLKNGYVGDSSKFFTGGIWRIGIYERRLRWFRDAPNWTWGFSGLEYILPDARQEKGLASVLPLYIRKRFYLSEKIPYIAFTAALGIGYYPSQYINVSGSLDIGSIAGLNIRAYAGLAAGVNTSATYQVRTSTSPGIAQSVLIPYAGLGMSFLDFLNVVPETKQEWKDMQNSGWNIGVLQASFVHTGASKTAIGTGDTSNSFFLNGYIIRGLIASVALPILNNQFYIGTCLGNLVVLGKNEWSLSILPIRFGYWQTILSDELSTEPFLEFGFYPSSYFHVGDRVNLKMTDLINIGFTFGYVSGTNSNAIGNSLTDQIGIPTSYSQFYFGISFGLFDKIFYPQDLRYNK